MITLKNVSTGKLYPVSKEDYEKLFKGKLNWEIVEESKVPKEQTISNTVDKPNAKTKTNKTKK